MCPISSLHLCLTSVAQCLAHGSVTVVQFSASLADLPLVTCLASADNFLLHLSLLVVLTEYLWTCIYWYLMRIFQVRVCYCPNAPSWGYRPALVLHDSFSYTSLFLPSWPRWCLPWRKPPHSFSCKYGLWQTDENNIAHGLQQKCQKQAQFTFDIINMQYDIQIRPECSRPCWERLLLHVPWKHAVFKFSVPHLM